MPKSWTRSPALHLDLPRAGTRRAAIEQALRDAISAGRIPAGAPLPSSRLLAADLQLSRGTVVEAYAQLVAEGYLVSSPRSGTRVADAVRGGPAGGPSSPTHSATPAAHDFRPTTSDLSGFPRTTLLGALRHAILSATRDDFGYGDPRGHPVLRARLADYLGRVRGLRTDAERIMICAGYGHALSLLMSALAVSSGSASGGPASGGAASGGAASGGSASGRVAIENPGLPANLRTVAYHGLTPISVAVDERGMRVGELSGVDVDAVLVTPAHQLPFGAVLHPSRRTELIRLAEQAGTLIVEDDYDGEFRYDRQPIGALQGLAPERVAYVGTTSKTLAPAMRLGWIAMPDRLVEPLVDARLVSDRHSPTVDQLALARLLETGALDRHLRAMRLRYRNRRDLFVSALAGALPAVRVVGVAAGYHVTLLLPDGTDEADVVQALADRDVIVHGLASYCHAGSSFPPGLVVGYGTPPQHGYTAAVDALISALSAVL